MGNVPLLGGIEVPSNLLEFAKDVALQHEIEGEQDEAAIVGAIDLMNKVLMPTYGGKRMVLKASRLYNLPYYDADIENLRESEVLTSQLPEAVLEGQIEYVQWFASISLKGFGLRLAEANFIEPNLPSLPKVYVPIEAINFGLLAA